MNCIIVAGIVKSHNLSTKSNTRSNYLTPKTNKQLYLLSRTINYSLKDTKQYVNINRLVVSFLSPFSIQMQNFQLKICIYKRITKTKKSGFHFQTKTNRLPYMFFFLEI